MPESELPDGLELQRLGQLIADLKQGDVVDVAIATSLFSPDAPSYPDEVAAVPHESPVMTSEVRLPSGLSVVLSQDCDLRRWPDLEPYLVIAPLTSVDETTYADAEHGLSSRYFAYPEVAGHEGKRRLVVDVRQVSSLEKTALLSPHLARLACPLTEAKREQLRRFAGRRFGREPFADDIQRQVIDPIYEAVKKVRKSPAHRKLFEAVIYYGLQYTPGKSYVSLLLLCDVRKRAAVKAGEQEINGLRKRLSAAIDQRTKNGDYQVTVLIHDVTMVPASELLGRAELSIDI